MIKRALFFLVLLPVLLWSESSDTILYREILEGLFPQKKTIKIYIDDVKKAKILKETGLPIKLVPYPQEADLLMISEKIGIPADKPIFAGTYRILVIYPNRAIGGFYWKKGRPTLIFSEKSLHRYHFKLPKKFEKYME